MDATHAPPTLLDPARSRRSISATLRRRHWFNFPLQNTGRRAVSPRWPSTHGTVCTCVSPAPRLSLSTMSASPVDRFCGGCTTWSGTRPTSFAWPTPVKTPRASPSSPRTLTPRPHACFLCNHHPLGRARVNHRTRVSSRPETCTLFRLWPRRRSVSTPLSTAWPSCPSPTTAKAPSTSSSPQQANSMALSSNGPRGHGSYGMRRTRPSHRLRSTALCLAPPQTPQTLQRTSCGPMTPPRPTRMSHSGLCPSRHGTLRRCYGCHGPWRRWRGGFERILKRPKNVAARGNKNGPLQIWCKSFL
mmetsp:Transcript_15856/g.34425  ORF Transcript_15856/g.34425 Transcript_15856/m.34425 type:complete len:302 (+) Transcript_15856:557-1462(+)